MKKFLLVILTLSCFGMTQAAEYKTSVNYRTNDARNFWIPAATVMTIAGLVYLNNNHDHDRYDEGIKLTVSLIDRADDLDELRDVRRDHSIYFTEEVNRYYIEKRDRLIYRDGNRKYSNFKRGEFKTMQLIEDADSMSELVNIRRYRGRYFSRDVERCYQDKEKEIKWRESREWRRYHESHHNSRYGKHEKGKKIHYKNADEKETNVNVIIYQDNIKDGKNYNYRKR